MRKLKEMRQKANLSREELAKKLGISVDSIKRYENGEREPRADVLFKLGEILNCSIYELFGKKHPFQGSPQKKSSGKITSRGQTLSV